MNQPAAERWDQHYREALVSDPSQPEPHSFLPEQAHRLPTGGWALDIACGRGGNAIWLAQRGLKVLAVDISQIACNELVARAGALRCSLEVICRDLEVEPLPDGPFAVIINTRYLQRDLAPWIEERLAVKGILIFSTLLEGGCGPPPIHKEFELQRGELRILFPNLEMLELHEDSGKVGRPMASLVARRP